MKIEKTDNYIRYGMMYFFIAWLIGLVCMIVAFGWIAALCFVYGGVMSWAIGTFTVDYINKGR